MNRDYYHLFVLIAGWLFTGYLTYIIWFRVNFYLKIMRFVERAYHNIFFLVNVSFTSNTSIWIYRFVFSVTFILASVGVLFLLLE